MSDTYDAIVLGAGAAGMMAAAVAGQAGKRVLLLEGADRPGKKILISGGGRCNFTNVNTAPDRFLSQNPHFAKSALRRYSPREFIRLVEAYSIAYHEKTLGQLFCNGPAQQIVDLLLAECEKGAVELRCDAAVTSVNYADGEYTVIASSKVATAPALVIATGGPSIPKMGASDFAYHLARQFGLKVVEPRPALVPLTLAGEDALFQELSGVSADVVTHHGQGKKGQTKFREAALFTHRGLSGPAILQISSYWRKGEPIAVNFLPDHSQGWLLEVKRSHPNTTLRKLLSEQFADRLAQRLVELLGLEDILNHHSDKAIRAAEERLRRWEFMPSGSEGFAKAEVTIGGISTAELSSKTMEAEKQPALYAIGEAVDVTGWLGGYNFQWAWASAQAAGKAIAERG